jgi:hypothetical protein
VDVGNDPDRPIDTDISTTARRAYCLLEQSLRFIRCLESNGSFGPPHAMDSVVKRGAERVRSLAGMTRDSVHILAFDIRFETLYFV